MNMYQRSLNFIFPVLSTALFLVFFAAFPGVLAAQLGAGNGVSVSAEPALPAPREKVVLTLTSYAVNLDTASISWSVNGTPALSGKGVKSFSFFAGEAGEAARVSVSVAPTGGQASIQSITLTPGEVDLVWEAVGSYAPPFYRGKALPSSESEIRVIALPNMKSGGTRLKAENLVYRWKRNQKTELGSSGYAKNSLSFKGGYEETLDRVEVTATTQDGAVGARGGAAIAISAPLIVFYEDRPLEGIHYEEALPARFTLGNEEMKVVAEPYFFSSREKDALPFEWRMNGKRTEGNEEDKSSITLRTPVGGSGIAALFLSIVHPSKLMQSKEGGLYLRYSDE